MKVVFILLTMFFVANISAQENMQNRFDNVESKVINWRRHIHQNPELSNREFETAKYIETHLRALGLEVQTGVAKTGVVGVLKGNKPGKVVALRADMDALPVTERVDLPFASKVVTEFNGEKTGVMHACGHDAHVAILMGAAEVLSQMKDEIQGTIKFIFQPAEEGAPEGETGGAEDMVKAGVLKNPDVDAIFGLHIRSGSDVGSITYKSGGMMAAAQTFKVTITGKQAHGSRPWTGVDPILVSANIIQGFQTIISREIDLTNEAAVITVGKIKSGIRSNIIPETAELIGTIRTLDYDMQKKINKRMIEIVEGVAKTYRAEATIKIEKGLPITYNSPDLVKQMLPTLQRIAGNENVKLIPAITGAEDFSFYQLEIPGFFYFLGGKPIDLPADKVGSHHTPDFFIDDSGLKLGVETMTGMALDFLNR